jgi:hypothetical protein
MEPVPIPSLKSVTRPQLRQDTSYPIIGNAKQLSGLNLPTNRDVLKHYFYIRDVLKCDRQYSIRAIANEICDDITSIWDKATIPFISSRRIVQKIVDFKEKHHVIIKNYNTKRREEQYYNKNVQTFQTELDQLFDICSCKCKHFANCNCEKSKKVPIYEREFVHDQRNDRNMVIGKIDKERTDKLQRKSTSGMQIMSEQLPISVSTDVFSSNIPSTSTTVSSITRSRTYLPNLAREADRYGVSDRATAALASAVLEDFGITNKEDNVAVIDRSKVRRDRSKQRHILQRARPILFESLYFDGRKDRTYVNEKKGNKYYQSIVSEEHYVLLQEPGAEYLGHITPQSGSSEHILDGIINFFNEKNISMDGLVCIGCDGTAVNTGVNAGIIRRLEMQLKKPLHWFICLLHCNELLLRHLMDKIDGRTLGPKSSSGLIGKAIESCEKLPITKFSKISLPELPNLGNCSDLSTDQKLLLDFCKAIAEGYWPEELARRTPGPISHARWLTKAIRILRLYVSTDNPSDNLKDLAGFVIKVYAPMWFHIKVNSSCIHGPQHICKMITLSRYMPEHQKSIINDVIQRNAFFAHSENILLAMLADERTPIRQLAFRRITEIRRAHAGALNIRQFKVPHINFKATEYCDLIDWSVDKNNLSEPPLTRLVENDDLKKMLIAHSIPSLNFIRFPCHTQSVERHIKLVTEASENVCGQERRDGYIRSKLQSRLVMPKFETKADYKFSKN